MRDWSMEHPYLTTSIALLVILALNNVIIQALSVIRKPAPTTFNLNVDGSEVKDLIDHERSGDMN